MGQVFTPEQITKGDYPEHADGLSQHNAAKELGSMLISQFGQLTDAGNDPIGWYVYGSSIAYGRPWIAAQPTRRSDVDLLTIVDDNYAKSVPGKVSQIVNSVEQEHGVRVGHSKMTTTELQNGGRADPFYVDHLHTTVSIGWNHRIRPRHRQSEADERALEAIFTFPDFEELLPFATSYLTARHQELCGLVESPPHEGQLQMPFETPRNTSRKIVELYKKYMTTYEYEERYDEETDNFTSPIDTLGLPPVKNLELLVGEIGLGEEVELGAVYRLSEMDAEYTALLEDVISGKISLQSYTKWLSAVRDDAFADARAVIESAHMILGRIVSMAQVNPNFGTEEYVLYGGSDVPSDEWVYARRPRRVQLVTGYSLGNQVAQFG